MYVHGTRLDAMVEFRDRLKHARLAAGLSQYTLSDATDIARTMIAGYEQGTHQPGLDGLTTLAKALGVSADYLLGLDATKPAKVPKGTKAKGKPASEAPSTVEEVCALAKAQGKTYCEHGRKAYRLRRDGWEPV